MSVLHNAVEIEKTKIQTIKGQNSQTAAATAKERLDKKRKERAKLQAGMSGLSARSNSMKRPK